MSTNTTEELFVQMLQIKHYVGDGGGHFNRILSICGLMNKFDSNRNHKFLLKCLWADWPEYSGCFSYPISVFNIAEGLTPQKQFELYLDKWDQSTEYGKARMRLLNWLIERLTFELGIY